MKWGLTQGILGREHDALAPSLAAVGPNSYLTRTDFFKTLGAALAVHLLVFGIASLFPHEKVTNIPVRALSFKLGDQDRIAAYSPAPATAAIAAPVMQATSDARVAPQTPRPQPVKPAKIEPTQVVTPVAKFQPRPLPVPMIQPLPSAPAIAPQPQQYVREVGQPTLAQLPQPAVGMTTGAIGGTGLQTTQTEQTSRAIRDRYEQEISGWIERHKLYPAEAAGRAGRVIVRMRIDRSGTVRYYAVEESSGVQAIDAAALDMIRRANPVPAAPVNYPAGSLIEFLIPITFRAPQ